MTSRRRTTSRSSTSASLTPEPMQDVAMVDAPSITPPASPVLSPVPAPVPAASSSASSSSSSTRKRRASSNESSAEERKRRRQEQNRAAAATSRQKNRTRMARLQGALQQLQEDTDRLQQQRDQLQHDQQEMLRQQRMMDTSSSSTSSSSSASLSTPSSLSRSPREPAAFASLPWRLQLRTMSNRPKLTRLLTTLCILALVLTASSLICALLTLTHSIHTQLPLTQPTASRLSPLPHLLLPSLLTLTALCLHLQPIFPSSFPSPPSLSRPFPTPPPLLPLTPLSVPPPPSPALLVRSSLASSAGRSHRFHPFLRTGRGSGIDGRALEGLRMRTGGRVLRTSQPSLLANEHRRGTDAHVELHPVLHSRWMMAMLVLAAVS